MEFEITYKYKGEGNHKVTLTATNEAKVRNKFNKRFTDCEIMEVSPV